MKEARSRYPEGGRRSHRQFFASLGVAIGGVSFALAPAAGSAPAASPRNVAVTPANLNFYGGPTLARNPVRGGHLAIAYTPSSGNTCYLALSANGGRTWHDLAVAGEGTKYPVPAEFSKGGGLPQCYFPTVTYGPDGRLYYAFAFADGNSGFARAQLMVAGASGRLGAPKVLDPNIRASDPHSGGGDYEPGLAAGRLPGQLYVVWKRYDTTSVHGKIQLIYSSDRGKHFSAPRQVNPSTRTTPQGRPFVAVDGSGRVYVNWLDETKVDFMTNGGRAQFELASSGDHGRTFRTKTIASIAAGCGPNFVSPCIPRTTMAAGAGGRVYAAWSGAAAAGKSRVFFSSSTSGGKRWTVPLKVVPGGRRGDDQYRPELSVAPDGRVDLEFNDTARATNRQDVYLTYSTNSGKTLSRAFRLDSLPSNTKFVQLLSDRIGVESSDGAAYAAWSDDRRASATTPQAQVFFAALSVTTP